MIPSSARCNSIVCLNRRLNRRLNKERTSHWSVIHRPFNISICISTLPTTFICNVLFFFQWCWHCFIRRKIVRCFYSVNNTPLLTISSGYFLSELSLVEICTNNMQTQLFSLRTITFLKVIVEFQKHPTFNKKIFLSYTGTSYLHDRWSNPAVSSSNKTFHWWKTLF